MQWRDAMDTTGPDVGGLCDAYRRVARERMQGLAVCNPALEVEAVGFADWQGRCLGILVAPWFMNLVLLPGARDDWRALPTGARQGWTLPGGAYEFTVSRVEGADVHQSCALFTTVLDFPDQDTARGVAGAVIDAVRRERGNAGHGVPMSRREFLRRGRDGSGRPGRRQRRPSTGSEG